MYYGRTWMAHFGIYVQAGQWNVCKCASSNALFVFFHLKILWYLLLLKLVLAYWHIFPSWPIKCLQIIQITFSFILELFVAFLPKALVDFGIFPLAYTIKLSNKLWTYHLKICFFLILELINFLLLNHFLFKCTWMWLEWHQCVDSTWHSKTAWTISGGKKLLSACFTLLYFVALFSTPWILYL